MKKHTDKYRSRDLYEYHGNTEVERVKKSGNRVVSREWVLFDTVEEAMDYFNAHRADIPHPGNRLPAWMIHAATTH